MVVIIAILLMVLAGFAKGGADYLQFRYYRVNLFWNPKLSWLNKWEMRDGVRVEKFFLSSTLLVFLTDGWHLMNFVWASSIFTAIGVMLMHTCGFSFVIAVSHIIVFRVAYGLGFYLSFEKEFFRYICKD
jgi:hypothetical protein